MSYLPILLTIFGVVFIVAGWPGHEPVRLANSVLGALGGACLAGAEIVRGRR